MIQQPLGMLRLPPYRSLPNDSFLFENGGDATTGVGCPYNPMEDYVWTGRPLRAGDVERMPITWTPETALYWLNADWTGAGAGTVTLDDNVFPFVPDAARCRTGNLLRVARVFLAEDGFTLDTGTEQDFIDQLIAGNIFITRLISTIGSAFTGGLPNHTVPADVHADHAVVIGLYNHYQSDADSAKMVGYQLLIAGGGAYGEFFDDTAGIFHGTAGERAAMGSQYAANLDGATDSLFALDRAGFTSTGDITTPHPLTTIAEWQDLQDQMGGTWGTYQTCAVFADLHDLYKQYIIDFFGL